MAAQGDQAIMGLFNMFSSRSSHRIVADEAWNRIKAGAVLLDVRTPAEFAGGSLEGATNLPVQDLAGRIADVPAGQEVICFCRSGQRSAAAVEILRQAGYTAFDAGGIGSLAR